MIKYSPATIGKHIVSDQTLPSGSKSVRIDKSAPVGVIIAGLEIVKPGFGWVLLCTRRGRPPPGMRTVLIFCVFTPIFKTSSVINRNIFLEHLLFQWFRNVPCLTVFSTVSCLNSVVCTHYNPQQSNTSRHLKEPLLV